MRIISGDFGGRRLKAVPSKLTRPTTDKVKESLFNMIGPYFKTGSILDLFAGSGSVGIEAISRGMKQAVLVDRQFAAVKTIKENIAITKHPEQFQVLKMSAKVALKQLNQQHQTFDYVFLDPPYKMQKMIQDLSLLKELTLLNPQAMVICETDDKTPLPKIVPGFKMLDQRHYGITQVSIYLYQEGVES